jgi:hypothetical protein
MGWISPVSYNDVDNKWSNEPNSYDGNTGTYASSTVNQYYHWLELNLAGAIICDKIRIYSAEWYGFGEGGSNVRIEVYDGSSWILVYEGTIASNQWVEKVIPGGPKMISKARVYNRYLAPGNTYMRLKEFAFNQANVNAVAAGGVSNNLLGA